MNEKDILNLEEYKLIQRLVSNICSNTDAEKKAVEINCTEKIVIHSRKLAIV